jgi:hypothetical protein
MARWHEIFNKDTKQGEHKMLKYLTYETTPYTKMIMEMMEDEHRKPKVKKIKRD